MIFSRVKFTVPSVIFLLLPVFLSGQTGKNVTYYFEENLKGGSMTSTMQSIIINYCLSELSLQGITNNEGNFFRISAPGHNNSSDPGKPELPVFSRIFTIPENSVVNIKIRDVRSEKLDPSGTDFKGLLYPRQVDVPKSQEKQKTGFVIDRALYNNKGLIESDTVWIEFLGKVRNKQLATIYISPVRYNPALNELEVITSMKVEISFADSSGRKSSSGFLESALFTETLDKGILNYNPSDVITGYSDKPVGMIVLTDTAFRKHLEPYITWKTRKGFRITTLYKGAKFAGSTFTQIKDTLTKIYKSATENNPAPEYLLIVGDVTSIPKSDGTSQVSDLYYGEFDGNGDYLPDMYIGRLPVTDTTELKAVVDKLVQYESFHFADTNTFYRRALITAGNDPAYATYMNGQVRYAVTNYLNKTNKIDAHSFYYPQSASSDSIIISLINNGLSFINYSGHADVSGWLDPTIKVPEVALFKNKNMYPFVISNACQTAHYNVTASFGNKMIVSADKGAVGFIGCSNDSYWDEDFYWSIGVGTPSTDPKYSETGLGAYDRLFHKNNESPSDWYITMGQVNYAGNMAVSSSTSWKKKYYWETYTLLGDPSVIPYIGQPDTFEISLPDTLPNGIRSLTMTIDPFAYMAVSHWDTLWDASFASPSGSVVLDLPEPSADSCLVIISGQNKVPLIKTIYFTSIKKEFINLTATGINDTGVNNNGLADFGESLYLKTTISNLGLTEANGLYGKLSTTSDWVTILNDSAYIGTLPGGSEIKLADHFAIKIDELIPDKGYITLNLKLKDLKEEKSYNIDICIRAPILEIVNCIIDDTKTGNGNHLADPGETVDLVFSVSNTGSSNISGTFNIINNPPGVTIKQPSVSTGILSWGKSITIPVSISLSPLLTDGSTFNISAMLDCNPYIANKSTLIAVGKVRESFEYQSFKIFPWQNSSAHPWIITNSQAFDGLFSARSAIITHNTESALKITVNVPVKDTVKFMYKVSSELNYDLMTFKLNGTQVMKISGEAGWSEKKVELKEGFNSLEWIYKKDESVSSGSDCATIDYITFPSASFKKVDLKTGKIVTPQSGKDYKKEVITAEVINFGSDTIKSFNLAYSVNDNPPVTEHFAEKILPADTIIAGFAVPANMEGAGIYLIKVYGINNNDGYLKNDTAFLKIYNTAVTSVENPADNVKVMPNPFDHSFRISFSSNSNDEVRISIFESAGRLIWEETFGVIPGDNILTITPENLPQGFYTLAIRGKTVYKASGIIKK